MTETQATLSVAELVFFNTTTKATNAHRTETPPPGIQLLDSTFIQSSGLAKWWMNYAYLGCLSMVVGELSPCHVPVEEDGILRDTTVHRRRGSFSV